MKVMMIPSWLNVQGHEPSGIQTVIKAYTRHFLAAGIELVDPKATSFDVLAVHAGMSKEYPNSAPMVAHLHGLYWSADYPAAPWEYKVNRDVIDGIRHATTITVPSAWVAESFQRDMHLQPHIVGHGIDWQEWQHSEPNEGYILAYAKNRAGSDVCSPIDMSELARRFPKEKFMGTYMMPDAPDNVTATGLLSHIDMRKMVQRSAVMVSTVKETFGVLHLEAMASGVPVLGFRQGGILETVEHGINGYLARPGDYDDLAKGLEYCLKHRDTLGANGREMAKRFTWQRVAEQLAGIYAETMAKYNQSPTVSVIIPCYNLAHMLARAVESAVGQADEVIIVDNNSTDDTKHIAKRLEVEYPIVHYTNCPEQGVAYARNYGVRLAKGQYICCLDSDDMIESGFLAACVQVLQGDRSLGIAYTRLRWIKPDGTTGISDWPGQYNYDDFLRKKNQVPTCCLFRKEMWQRLGGYRQRYAPDGQGAEDAEFFLRAGALGWGAKLATEEALFVYSWGSGRVSGNAAYQEPDWLIGHPWVEDRQHPFASMASPVNKLSHPVRQYDAPTISIIIPCSLNHRQHLIDALDSLEAQTFRQWETIVVCDGFSVSAEMHDAYPFVYWTECTQRGAGAARNLGAAKARGHLLLFLDADDWLRPKALERLLHEWNQTQAITYSDYAGHAYIDDKNEIAKLRGRHRLESYNERTHEAVVIHQSFDYDYELAVIQPRMTSRGEFYIWNLITSLVPKAWHNEIGGFDEKMPSWEDWDYWLRLARRGKPFVRIPDVLVEYRFYTGTRRETGRQIHQSLLEYMTEKYRGTEIMPCGSCGGKRSGQPTPVSAPQMAPQMAVQMSAGNIIWVRLNDGNIGQHPIVGNVTRTNYGYRVHGDLFKMMASDAQAAPHKYVIVPDPNTIPAQMAVAEISTPEPVAIAPTEFTSWDKPMGKLGLKQEQPA